MYPERGVLVSSGAGRAGGRSEAKVMAAYARDVLGVTAERIELETATRPGQSRGD